VSTEAPFPGKKWLSSVKIKNNFHNIVLSMVSINTNLLSVSSSTDVSTSKDPLKVETLGDGGVNQLSSLMIKTQPCNRSDSGYNSKSPSGSSEGN
jgi:hypothetical protein